MNKQLLIMLLFFIVLAGCAAPETAVPAGESNGSIVTSETAVPTAVEPLPEPTDTPLLPTETPEPTPVPPSYELSANYRYVTDRNPKHTLDVYMPLTGEAPYPTLFMLHPGGFTDGNKEEMLPFATYFASQGYASVVPNYRLVPEDIYPAQLQDSFCALAWTHANAGRIGLDPARIVTFGYSSGAYLAGMIGTIDDPQPYLEDCSYALYDDWTQGVIVLAGQTILADYPTDEFAAYLGGSVADVPELWQEAAPVTYLDETDPPCLVSQGEVDELLPMAVSEQYVAALSAADVEHLFLHIPDAGHFFPLDDFSSDQTRMFLSAAAEFMATLPPRPPLLEKPRVLMTLAEGLVGLWQMAEIITVSASQQHVLYIEFMADGRFVSDVDTTEFNNFSAWGEYWFEDGIFNLVFDDAAHCNGFEVVGSYEVEILAEGQITFHKVSDTCSSIKGHRSSNFESVWERISSSGQPGLDQESGLPINPVEIPDGPFIVEGVVGSVETIPADAPVFKIEWGDQVIWVLTQPLADIKMADGSAVMPHEFLPGMTVRATVRRLDDPDAPTQGFYSDDLVVLAKRE